MNVVDSSAWLAYLADEPTADFFSQAIEDAELLIVPSVCIYVVFKVIVREKGEDDAFLAIEAAAVGNDEKLAFADSIIYTITQKYNATLWTQDGHFAQKPGVQYIEKKKS